MDRANDGYNSKANDKVKVGYNGEVNYGVSGEIKGEAEDEAAFHIIPPPLQTKDIGDM